MLVMPFEMQPKTNSKKAEIFNKIFSQVENLPTLPGIAMKILEAVRKEEPDILEIGDLLSKDPPLCIKVLKLINSSFYGLSTKVSSVHHALKLLGLVTVQNIALSFSLLDSYNSKRQSNFDYTLYWKKSLIGAIAAKLIAEKVQPDIEGNIFFLGLLQDIGILTLGHCFPRQFNLVENEADRLGVSFQKSEEFILGYNHQEIGKYLTKSWGLPKSFYLPILYHHKPVIFSRIDPKILISTQILYLSSIYMDMFTGEANAQNLWLIEKAAKKFGFYDKLDLDEIGDRISGQVLQIFPYFELSVEPDETANILEKARAEMSKLSIELIEKTMKQEKEIENLKHQVVRDSMTQLFNHQYFREILQNEIYRAKRYNVPLSIILSDIDRFKTINDTFGHPVGDVVIKSVADALQAALRDSDYLARYGGEEFAIVLTETNAKSALKAAERLRKIISSLNIRSSAKHICTTMSFGVASLNHKENNEIDDLIRMADNALYRAKETGRNRCCLYSHQAINVDT